MDESALFALVLLAVWGVIMIPVYFGVRSAYRSGVMDGFAVSQDPEDPGIEKAKKYLVRKNRNLPQPGPTPNTGPSQVSVNVFTDPKSKEQFVTMVFNKSTRWMMWNKQEATFVSEAIAEHAEKIE